MQKGTQVKILENAEDLFWSNGHKATSLDLIARKAGQSKGAIFHYYRSKGDITRQVLAKYSQEELFDPLKTQFTQHSKVKDALLAWVQGIYDSYRDKGFEGGCLLGGMALELADQDAEIRGQLIDIFQDWEDQLVGHFETHATDGQIVMKNRQFARLLIATLEGVMMTIKVHKDEERAQREFAALVELIEGFIAE